MRKIRWSKEKIVEEILKLERKNAKYAKTNFNQLYSAAQRHFGSWITALKACGIDPEPVIKCRIRPREEILEDLKSIKNKRCKYNQIHKPYLHSYAIRYFGSWKAAIEAAGFDYSTIVWGEKWTKDRVIQEIKALDNKSVSCVIKTNNKLAQAAQKYWGSWENAITAAGFDYDEIRKCFTNERLLADIIKDLFIGVKTQKDL